MAARKKPAPKAAERRFLVGTAAWSIPARSRRRFPAEGSHLERYASRLACVEINSSFYRSHQPGTYVRWAASVPEGFRFAVKVPKEITHERRLKRVSVQLDRFLEEAGQLRGKLGCLLVQLPGSFACDAALARRFFAALRKRYAGPVAFEPRHPSWFEPKVDRLLEKHRISRVAADPARVPKAADPGGWCGTVYFRLHGSPRMYWSNYSRVYLERLAGRLLAVDKAHEVWCIFDNTALGAATANALDLAARLAKRHPAELLSKRRGGR